MSKHDQLYKKCSCSDPFERDRLRKKEPPFDAVDALMFVLCLLGVVVTVLLADAVILVP